MNWGNYDLYLILPGGVVGGGSCVVVPDPQKQSSGRLITSLVLGANSTFLPISPGYSGTAT